jgi:aspartyl-tRNA(Asn)/glutamyl-tRNA(Gln) amidotransferase subunit A
MAPLAIGAVTRHPTIGTCRSPLDPDRHAGGSSGGSGAAVGAGIVPFALGSDTMGSVRIPAAYCGVAAWLPTHTALSATGLTPLQSDLDNVGVIAATAADLDRVAAVLVGQGDRTARSVDALTRVRQCDLTPRADDAARAACEIATSALLGIGLDSGPTLTTDIDPAVLRRQGLILVEVQAAQTFAAQLAAGVIPDEIASLLRYGQGVTEQRVTAAHAALRDFAARIAADLRPGDVVVLPTTPAEAPHVSEDPAGAADLTAWVNAAGLPAVAVPVAGRSVQLVASAGDDERLLALAADLAAQVPKAGGLRSRNADTPS